MVGRSGALAASSAQSTSAATAAQRLADLEMFPIISVQGFIQPEIPEATEASVFAIYDQVHTVTASLRRSHHRDIHIRRLHP